jgi:acyl carrier protein
MTTDEIRQTVLQILGEIAPEADLARIEPQVDFRDQLDLDSMDALNFIIGVDKALGVEIPEADYGRTATLDDFVAYLAERLHAPAAA